MKTYFTKSAKTLFTIAPFLTIIACNDLCILYPHLEFLSPLSIVIHAFFNLIAISLVLGVYQSCKNNIKIKNVLIDIFIIVALLHVSLILAINFNGNNRFLIFGSILLCWVTSSVLAYDSIRYLSSIKYLTPSKSYEE